MSKKSLRATYTSNLLTSRQLDTLRAFPPLTEYQIAAIKGLLRPYLLERAPAGTSYTSRPIAPEIEVPSILAEQSFVTNRGSM